MTIDTWMKEFYPISADDLTIEDNKDSEDTEISVKCIEHSIRKWKGLTKENLKKHDVVLNVDVITDIDWKEFVIDGGTCALCQDFPDCFDVCPLSIFLGEPCCRGTRSPYGIFIQDGNPLPMIEALEGTLKKYQEKEK